jgi:hypothetical protein
MGGRMKQTKAGQQYTAACRMALAMQSQCQLWQQHVEMLQERSYALACHSAAQVCCCDGNNQEDAAILSQLVCISAIQHSPCLALRKLLLLLLHMMYIAFPYTCDAQFPV